MIIQFNQLPEIREQHQGQQIVFVTGVFDLTHPGHVLFLEFCRNFGDVLVVGIGNDTQVARLKPDRPIWNETWRAKMIASLKPVDYCFIGPPETATHHLKIVEMGFGALRPDVYAINDDVIDIPDRRLLAYRFVVNLVVIERAAYPPEFFGVSTSAILEKVNRR